MKGYKQMGTKQKTFVNPHKILDDLDPLSNAEQVRERFLKLSKKYHPDMHQNEKEYYEKKFKEINLAYEQIKGEMKEEFKNLNNNQSINRPNQKFETDYEKQRQANMEEEKRQEEQEIHMNGQQRMSREEYEQWQRDFIKRREWRREESRRQQNMTEEEKQQEEKKNKVVHGIVSIFILIGGFVVYTVGNDLLDNMYLLEETKEIDDKIKNYQENVKDLSRFEEESVQKYKLMQEQADDYQIRFHIQYYYIRQPIMKKFPIRHKHPHAENMLVDFTLYPDIKLYEVPAKMFINYELFSTMEEKELIGRNKQFQKQQLGFCKIQTKLSHAIEAERILKNVYVKKDYVRKQIIQNGYYKPPPIYFRYYGYIQLKLRRKPINVEKFIECDKPYISLFDLFFKYNTPLNLAYDIFYDFKMFGYGDVQGNIKFNHRKIRPVYIDDDSIKNIFCWWYRKSTSNMKQEDIDNLHKPKYCDGEYEAVWDGFYGSYCNKILTKMM